MHFNCTAASSLARSPTGQYLPLLFQFPVLLIRSHRTKEFPVQDRKSFGGCNVRRNSPLKKLFSDAQDSMTLFPRP